MSQQLTTFLKLACQGGAKKAQMAIAQAMQDWVCDEINQRLAKHGSQLKANPKAHGYVGGWRTISVDIHIGESKFGLLLAVDPKHLQGQSVEKNWNNTLNDLIAFSANFHTRFPLCVVGGMIGFKRSDIKNPNKLKDMYSVVEHVATRDRPTDPLNLLEAFSFVAYECNPFGLSPNVPPPGSNLRADKAIDRMVDLLIQRNPM
jgi:hypothetical protein